MGSFWELRDVNVRVWGVEEISGVCVAVSFFLASFGYLGFTLKLEGPRVAWPMQKLRGLSSEHVGFRVWGSGWDVPPCTNGP